MPQGEGGGMEIDMREDLNLNVLGNQNIKYEFQYNPELLETFENATTMRKRRFPPLYRTRSRITIK